MARRVRDESDLIGAEGDGDFEDRWDQTDNHRSHRSLNGRRADAVSHRRRIEDLQEQRMLRSLLSDLDSDYPEL
ncbi:hypothetical protein J2T57_003533 [Natronocella acetinitrilica]|uniref:Uncharacterized protein n=1 Tax=Natronocella acetinitrilica TaxID=414046 RepID=A0AAE3KHI1_9GAMM|nr:hypothetical protein [Natronocella acetinitrilica]MCP1676372.1 hypothetical protein [Natronocella acetinitrilica]